MTKNLPARVEEYTPLQAQSTFTDTEQNAFDVLSKYITDHEKITSMWYWELGQKVKKIYLDAKSKQELYGNKVLLRLAVGLGYKTDRQLRNAMGVCKAFGTKKSFTQFLKLKGEAGNTLRWSHLVYLSAVGDTEMRMQLAAAALEQTWTADELWAKVKALCERTPRGTRSPATKVPTSARNCLVHLQSQATKFNFNYDHAWTGDAFDLAKTVKEMPVDKLNTKLLDAVKAARKEITNMKTKAIEMSNVLAVAQADIEDRRESQGALEAQMEIDGVTDEAEDDDNLVPMDRNKKQAAKEKRDEAKRKKAAKAARAGKKGKARAGRVGT